MRDTFRLSRGPKFQGLKYLGAMAALIATTAAVGCTSAPKSTTDDTVAVSSSETTTTASSTRDEETDQETSQESSQEPSQEPSQETENYAAMLDELEIKGRAPMTGYDRDNFGPSWSDDVDVEGGHNGCDTRNDILQRDLDDPHIRPGTHDCLVERGNLISPYTDEAIDFERGDRQVHIDHVVALGDAWAKGAQQWDEDKRHNFANDPINLLAVDAASNMQKGAGDVATWLPPKKPFRCEYGKIHIRVKHEYQLWVTQAEHDAMGRLLESCDES